MLNIILETDKGEIIVNQSLQKGTVIAIFVAVMAFFLAFYFLFIILFVSLQGFKTCQDEY